MAIGINWDEVWKAVWKAVWTNLAPQAENVPIIATISIGFPVASCAIGAINAEIVVSPLSAELHIPDKDPKTAGSVRSG